MYNKTTTFLYSDQIIQSFHIRIGLVDDALPVLSSHGLRVQEGIRKLITEFDLKAEDQDTEVLIFLHFHIYILDFWYLVILALLSNF